MLFCEPALLSAHSDHAIALRMRVVERIEGFARIGVIAQGCGKKYENETISFDFRTGIGVIAQGCDNSAENPHFGGEVACYREWLRNTY